MPRHKKRRNKGSVRFKPFVPVFYFSASSSMPTMELRELSDSQVQAPQPKQSVRFAKPKPARLLKPEKPKIVYTKQESDEMFSTALKAARSAVTDPEEELKFLRSYVAKVREVEQKQDVDELADLLAKTNTTIEPRPRYQQIDDPDTY
jgi:hypothetical protein